MQANRGEWRARGIGERSGGGGLRRVAPLLIREGETLAVQKGGNVCRRVRDGGSSSPTAKMSPRVADFGRAHEKRRGGAFSGGQACSCFKQRAA